MRFKRFIKELGAEWDVAGQTLGQNFEIVSRWFSTFEFEPGERISLAPDGTGEEIAVFQKQVIVTRYEIRSPFLYWTVDKSSFLITDNCKWTNMELLNVLPSRTLTLPAKDYKAIRLRSERYKKLKFEQNQKLLPRAGGIIFIEDPKLDIQVSCLEDEKVSVQTEFATRVFSPDMDFQGSLTLDEAESKVRFSADSSLLEILSWHEQCSVFRDMEYLRPGENPVYCKISILRSS